MFLFKCNPYCYNIKKLLPIEVYVGEPGPLKPLRIQEERYSKQKLTERGPRVNKLTHMSSIKSHLVFLCSPPQCCL